VFESAKSDDLWRVLHACRSYFLTAAVFSLGINLLYLASPLYMLQIYDRVISSASVSTLVMLTLVLLVALAALAGLDIVRSRVLTRASIRLDRFLSSRLVNATIEQSVRGGNGRSQPVRDFDTFRQFITGNGIHAMFDMPWAPIYILVIFALHPWLGAFAFLSAIALVLMALVNEWVVKGPMNEATEAAAKNYAFTEMSLRNAEVVQAMGMGPGLLTRWSRDRNKMIERQSLASDRAATTSSIIKFLRLAVQSLILALGAWLVIERQITVGAMFAASILLGRALQPVEQVVGSWRGFVSARSAFQRMARLLNDFPAKDPTLGLPRPKGRVSVEELLYAPFRGVKPILRGVSFRIEPGEVLGVIGPSGAGKSTLARQIVGVLAPTSGVVRLDGADVAIWPREALGRHIGYLPQDIELFADTVAANISRFRTDVDDDHVVEAAKMAGVYDIILRLPQGFETYVGEGGAVLSGGIRQRIGLARAVFGVPSLVVLDEPSSNLDSDGDSALLSCISDLKRLGSTVVMVTHRPNTLGAVDKLLVLREGMVESIGPRDEVIQRLAGNMPRVQVVARGGA
jgi:PrtD family type I secretion system ABC transporter